MHPHRRGGAEILVTFQSRNGQRVYLRLSMIHVFSGAVIKRLKETGSAGRLINKLLGFFSSVPSKVTTVRMLYNWPTSFVC